MCIRQAQRRGFTLIELLVVVAIIALLISILLPSLGAAREQARGVKCLANVAQVGVCLAMYADENSDHYPIATGVAHEGGWLRTLQKFAQTPLLYRCPNDRSTDWYDETHTPAEHLQYDRKSSYAMSIYISPEVAPPPGAPDQTPRYGFDRRGRIRYPAETVHFSETAETHGFDVFADHIHAFDWLPQGLTGAPVSSP